MDFKDYYGTLGVAKKATAKEIKQAYRKLARKFHPDVNPGDHASEARFKDITEAYEVLGDADKRRKYDELGANWRQYEQQAQAGGPGAGWPADMGGGGFRTMSEEQMRDAFGGADPFSDFFNMFFGGAAGPGAGPGAGARGGPGARRAPRPRAGRDVEQPLQLTLEDAFGGATRRLAITRDGQSRTVDVRIPAGVHEGARVRVAGEGEPGSAGGPPGSLLLRIRLRPHSTFERRDQDLHVKAAVDVTTAVLGGEAEVPTLGGDPVRLKIPAATQGGQVLRLKGRGMPAVGHPTRRGDLYVTVAITVPTELTPEEREHYEALRKLEGARHSAA